MVWAEKKCTNVEIVQKMLETLKLVHLQYEMNMEGSWS